MYKQFLKALQSKAFKNCLILNINIIATQMIVGTIHELPLLSFAI
jgi:hypothetical protein